MSSPDIPVWNNVPEECVHTGNNDKQRYNTTLSLEFSPGQICTPHRSVRKSGATLALPSNRWHLIQGIGYAAGGALRTQTQSSAQWKLSHFRRSDRQKEEGLLLVRGLWLPRALEPQQKHQTHGGWGHRREPYIRKETAFSPL